MDLSGNYLAIGNRNGDPHMTTKRKWHSGPPPHKGWWNASFGCNDFTWRWWDSKEWSFCAFNGDDCETAAVAASRKNNTLKEVRWTTYWPRNARVPRIKP